ncbi:MAG: ATP-binding protein [Verrucomicrobia bacterium]|jgi:signal transduction histidine kinase|nr:ATP-binding protein [Verrucomicrobiota bacterium]
MTALESCELFAGAGPAAMDALRAVAEERVLGGGSVVFEEGAPGDGLYVVAEGEVEITASLDVGPHRLVSRLGPGEPFGEMAFIESKPRSARACTSQPSRLIFLPSKGLQAILDKHPVLATGFLKQVSHRLRDFTQHFIRQTLETERLALVGRFTGSIIHDLKNPLGVISLSAEVLGEGEVDAVLRQECSKRIRRQVERITDMVGEVLEFTRPEKQTFVPLRMRHAQFLEQMLEEERPGLAARGVRVEIEGKLPETELLLNPKRMHRVFVNLLNNAAEAMGYKGRIWIRCVEDARGVTTEVEDSGPGIAPEVAERLFDPFVTHGKPQGTGLGLAIARNIVNDHRGRLTAANAPGGGARFTLWLPKPGEA